MVSYKGIYEEIIDAPLWINPGRGVFPYFFPLAVGFRLPYLFNIGMFFVQNNPFLPYLEAYVKNVVNSNPSSSAIKNPTTYVVGFLILQGWGFERTAERSEAKNVPVARFLVRGRIH